MKKKRNLKNKKVQMIPLKNIQVLMKIKIVLPMMMTMCNKKIRIKMILKKIKIK
jgi:hypothetical protein